MVHIRQGQHGMYRKSLAQPLNTVGTSTYRWSNCYTGESKTHVLSIGVGTMYTFVCPIFLHFDFGTHTLT